jgi:uncharacterized protein (DUF1330 family)
MPAYLIDEHIITDPAKFGEYVTEVRPMIAKHGGRYLTKGSTHKLPEGGHWKPERGHIHQPYCRVLPFAQVRVQSY